MKTNLFIIFLLMIFIPLGIFSWLGARALSNEKAVIAGQFNDLRLARLRQYGETVRRMVQRIERALSQIVPVNGASVDELRGVIRSNGLIGQIFILGGDGKLIYPNFSMAMTDQERQFLLRTRKIWEKGMLLFGAADEKDNQNNRQARQTGEDVSSSRRSASEEKGWHVWFWENGINLIFWRRLGDGRIIGVELDRYRLISDIIATLPETKDTESGNDDARITLTDANNDLLYQWGKYAQGEKEPPKASLPLTYPLTAFKLHYYAASEKVEKAFSKREFLSMGSLLLLGVSFFLVLAVFFYFEYARQFHEASRKVSFVNRVSHELKTPLTNIRMYAELLEGNIDKDDAPERRYISVITAECQRLSRLINNVLTFSKRQNSKLTINTAPGNIDQCLDDLIRQFKPSFDRKSIHIDFSPGVAQERRFDPDALGQIVLNLFSNVEKYAAEGKHMDIQSGEIDDERIWITVSDKGVGIPPRIGERIFEPFYRLSESINEGVSGTGIGLTIARDLARLHGGDLVLIPAAVGAAFRIELKAPVTSHPPG